jgi:hypothetical protein
VGSGEESVCGVSLRIFGDADTHFQGEF